MFKLTRWIAALSAVFFAAWGLAACGGIPGNAVVQVNGQAVSKETFNHWLGIAASASASATPGQTAPKQAVPEPPAYTKCIAHLKEIEPKPTKGQQPKTEPELKAECAQQYKALKQQVLGYLIGVQWVFGQASEQGIKLSDKEVVAHFNKLKKEEFPQEAKFQTFLRSTNQTVADLLVRVKLQMLETKIQEKVTKEAKKPVTEATVSKYYNAHKALYGQPERRDLRLILTKTEAAAQQAKKEVESGKSFASVAKSKSIDPTSKANGGEVAGVVKGAEQKALSEAVFAASKGVLSGPVKTPFGYYIFEVKATHAPTQQPFAKVKESIKQQLSSQQEETAFAKFTKEFKAKWKGRTECRSEYLVEYCKQYKAPKTTASGAAGAAGAAGASGAAGAATPAE